MRIRFTETVVYETEGPGKGPVYEAGSVHEVSDDFAGRWLRRKVAVIEPDPPAPEQPAPSPERTRRSTRKLVPEVEGDV